MMDFIRTLEMACIRARVQAAPRSGISCWEHMTLERYDLVVLGAGSGGARAVRVAAQRGLRVAIAGQSRVGGT